MSAMTPTKIATTGTYLSWKIFVDLRIRRGKLRTNILIKHIRLRMKCVRSSYDKNVRTKFNKTTRRGVQLCIDCCGISANTGVMRCIHR